MDMKRRMASQRKPMERKATQINEKLYREEKGYRADLLVEKWSKVPEIGKGIKEMDTKTARNLAILLENQTRAMSKMTEAQMSNSFGGQTPENMLRLVRLVYPNSIRGQVFTEIALETMNDSIKYAYPVYTNASRSGFDFEGEGYKYGKNADFSMTDRFDAGELPTDPMYASTESRYATELVNVPLANCTVSTTTVTVKFVDDDKTHAITDAGFIEKDATIYVSESEEEYKKGKKYAIAVNTNDGWFCGKEVTVGSKTVKATHVELKDGVATVTLGADGTGLTFSAVGRYDSERDLTGKYLGEVEIALKTYHFRPRPITLGVTWTKLTELVLDTSFGISAEEMLMDSASQEIKKTLDYQAVKYGIDVQSVHAPENYVTFDAEGGKSGGNDDSYWHTAQIVNQAIGHVSDNMFDAFGRGGVSAIVGGSRFCRYLELNEGWSTKGKQSMIGGHKVGELNGIPVFAVPSKVMAQDEALTTWKNDTVENDVSIVIGTILPFFSTGALQRKNLYVESAVARFEDTQALQPKYLGRVKIEHIR